MIASAEVARPAERAANAPKKPRDGSNNDLEMGRSGGDAARAFLQTTRVAPAERSENSTGVRRRHSTGSLSAAPQRPRRRSSVLADLARAVNQAMPAADDAAAGAAHGGAPNIQLKVNSLFEHLCNENHTSVAAAEALVAAWRRETFRTIHDPLLLSFFDDVLPSMMARYAQLEKNHRVAKKKTVVWTVMLTYFDTLSDYSAYVVLEMAGSAYATPMLVVLVASMVMQALTVHFVTREGPVATVGALLGFKPILDGVNIVFDVPPRAGAIRSLEAFGWTRAVETASESIPFAVMQALALMERRSVAQWISFAISVGNIAHAVASVDYSFDTSPRFRAFEPLLYGCYAPGARGDGLFASTTIFALGYVTAKLVALAVFGAVAGASLAFVLVGESVTLLLVRIAIGNWRWLNPAGDSAIFSLIVHFVGVYPSMLAAPFPLVRHPFCITPLLYAGFIVWTLSVTNPLMLALALRYYDIPPEINPWVIWAIWGCATILCVLATLLSFVLMEPDFRGTFYRHRTMTKHVREGHWVRSTKCDGARITCTDDLDAVRAISILGPRGFAKAYWPMDLARQWVREGWAGWLSSQPEWFTEEWRERIPVDEWLAGSSCDDSSGSAVLISTTKQEATFRRVVGHTPPWDLNARDFEIFLDERFVKSTELVSTKSEVMKRGQLAYQIASAGGVGFLERCCATGSAPPWVRISNAANGMALRGNEIRIQQLTHTLCASGLSFYYQLYAASVSHSPLHGYTFISPVVQNNADYELTLVRNRQTEQLAILTLTSFDKLERTQMAREKKTLSDIERACVVSEFVATLHHWGSNGTVVFILGEYCGGGPLTTRIKPHVGIERDQDFWRLAFQLAQGIADIHAAGLHRMDIQARSM